MKFIPLVPAALAVSGLILAGCSLGPQLSLENYRAPGIPQTEFGAGEVPVLAVAMHLASEVTWRVTRVTDGSIVLQRAIVPLPNRGYDPAREVTHFQLPELAVGEYTAELWSKGQLIGHTRFSITSKPATTPYEMAHPTGVTPRSARPPHSATERNELNALLGLSPEQMNEIDRLLTAEDAAMAHAAPTETGAIVRKTKADIRELLTPEQQHLYDNVHGSIGLALGRERQRQSRLAELNDTLGLSSEQSDQIARLLAAEADNLAQAAPGAGKLQIIRQKTDADIRALLTPEQQQGFDSEPKFNSAEIEQQHAAQAFVVEYLKRCPAIISRDGPVADITPAQQRVQTSPERESGIGIYEVKGGTRSEAYKVEWEKPRSAPFRILKIEAADGEIVPLD